MTKTNKSFTKKDFDSFARFRLAAIQMRGHIQAEFDTMAIEEVEKDLWNWIEAYGKQKQIEVLGEMRIDAIACSSGSSDWESHIEEIDELIKSNQKES